MDKVMQIVEEEIEMTRKIISARIKRYFKDGNQTSARTNMKLEFTNEISRVILTGEEIKGEGGAPIEIALIDDLTGTTVGDGPEASASVEIVLLRGERGAPRVDDWTVEQFDDEIMPEIEGKQHLLAGNVPLKLQRGVGVLEKIKLRHHASKIRPSMFKLGARLVESFDGVRVKEAMTESFTVKDFRNKYYKKHETPSLSDEVWRLVNIRKGGNIDKRLRSSEIRKVEDFLIRLLTNPDELERIVSLGLKKWEATVSNARACESNGRAYCYINHEQNRGVVFNVLGQVLGLYIGNRYSSMSMLSEKQKVDAQELLASACKNWGDVKPVDDANSLKPDCPHGGHENAEASEMVGESSSRRSNLSFQSLSSAGGDFGSFSTDDLDVEIMRDDFTHTPFDFNAMFPDFDEFLQQNDGLNMPVHGLVDESNNDVERRAASETPKRWMKLLCVSRWFSIRKRVAVDVAPNRKKQKIDQQ